MFKASLIGKVMNPDESMTEKRLETAVGDRIVEDHHNRVVVVLLAVELLDREEAVTRGEVMLKEGVVGVLLLAMVLNNQFRKHMLFR